MNLANTHESIYVLCTMKESNHKCLLTDEWIKKMKYVYAMEYYYYKKEWNNAICSNMDGPRDYYTKWSKSEKDKEHDTTYMWNLKYDTSGFIYKTKTHRQRKHTYGYQRG